MVAPNGGFRTCAGRATIVRLRLNRPKLTYIRELMKELGLHPRDAK